MYVILVNPDDTLYGSKKCRIVQRQKLVNTLVFVVDPIYNGIDMTSATVMLEYILPVSREYKTAILSLSSERYNDCFLQYKLPFDIDLTSQAGNLELQLTFAYVEMAPSGVGIQRVRKTTSTFIEIVPISAWSDIVPDSALSSLDQRLIKMDAQMRALDDYMNVIDNKQVDNLVYNPKEDVLHLSSKGNVIGNKVSVKELLDDGIPVVELGSSSGNNQNPDHNDGCDCGCEDNVVEFGDYPEIDDNIEDDDNVVEF